MQWWPCRRHVPPPAASADMSPLFPDRRHQKGTLASTTWLQVSSGFRSFLLLRPSVAAGRAETTATHRRVQATFCAKRRMRSPQWNGAPNLKLDHGCGLPRGRIRCDCAICAKVLAHAHQSNSQPLRGRTDQDEVLPNPVRPAADYRGTGPRPKTVSRTV